MRAFNALARLLAVGVPVVLMAGCDLLTDSKETTPPVTNWEDSTDLQSDFGGYTMSDEPVAFGDPEMSKVEAVEGAPQEIAEPDTLPNDSTYVVRVLWGQLQGNRAANTVIDWSGSVSVSDGRLAVLRTIAFEMPADHLVRPRTSPQSVAFVSHTEPSLDGLLLVVRAATPPGGDTPAAAATFTLATAPYTHTWTLAELVGTNLVIPVDALGNAVSIEAMTLRPHECPKGFARGAWVARDGERGVFRGVWLATNGMQVGFVRGHFGVTESGDHVWFAKIIGREGRVIGLARGQWAPNADPSQPGGTFEGHFATRDDATGGAIAGRYVPGREATDGSLGFFEARWARDCDATPPTGDPGREPGNPR